MRIDRYHGATVVRMGGASPVPLVATASADEIQRLTRRIEWLRERASDPNACVLEDHDRAAIEIRLDQ